MRLYREDRDEAVTYLFGQSAKVTAQSLMSLVMFCRGEVDSALALGLETMRAANQLRHPLSKAIAATYIGGWVLGLCGAKDEVQREARRLIEFCDLHNVRIFRAYGELFLGWALCGDGHVAQGMWLMEQAIAAFDQAGWRLCERLRAQGFEARAAGPAAWRRRRTCAAKRSGWSAREAGPTAGSSPRSCGSRRMCCTSSSPAIPAARRRGCGTRSNARAGTARSPSSCGAC